MATVLLYLGEVLEGGETSLPLGIPIDEEKQKMVNPSKCTGVVPLICCYVRDLFVISALLLYPCRFSQSPAFNSPW